MEKSITKTLIIVSGILLLAVLGFLAVKSMSSSQTVSVNGQSTLTASPDIVAVYFNVETSGKTSQEANNANSVITDKLIAELLKLGFERKDIQTQNFNVYPWTEWENGKSFDKGFKATHSIIIKFSANETDKIGDVLDAGINSGAGISYINFELSPELESKYKAEAMKTAASDAKIKAQAIADGFDKKVGRLVSTSVNEFGYNPWNIYTASGASSDIAVAKESVRNIQPSDKEVTASITATFKLR
jgi:uncharacterized protein